jgi:hypothetical protein
MRKRSSTPNAAAQVRLGPVFKEVEDWRRRQAKIPPRSHAIRHLLKRGIEAEKREAKSPPAAADAISEAAS